jgi:Alcohol dehydrogenase transcription factor Myb/SANT-like
MFKQRELLWNEQHRSYGSELLRTKAWRVMAKDMDLSVDKCQRLVQRIRASYEFRRKSSTSYQLAKNQPEWFYVAESFLKPIAPPAPPPIFLEMDLKLDVNVLVKKESVELTESCTELEIPMEAEVKIETSEAITSKTTCRNCLKTPSDNQVDQLISIDEQWDDQRSLKQVYIELIGPTDSRLPSVVCSSCAELLQRFLEFRTISQANAKIYLDTVAGIYNEHNYDRETSKDKPCDQEDEEGDADHEDTIVFVEPLPKLKEECKIVKVTPRIDVDAPVEEKTFVDQSEWVRMTELSFQNYWPSCSSAGRAQEENRTTKVLLLDLWQARFAQATTPENTQRKPRFVRVAPVSALSTQGFQNPGHLPQSPQVVPQAGPRDQMQILRSGFLVLYQPHESPTGCARKTAVSLRRMQQSLQECYSFA